MEITPEQGHSILDLARETIWRLLDRQPRLMPTDPPAPLTPTPGSTQAPLSIGNSILDRPAGCFVSLHQAQTHKLRGCVGRLDASDPLGAALRAAAASVLQDPRFADDPVSYEELPDLELEVSVLSPLSPTAGPLAFDRLNDGIYLTIGRRSGCFLPQVARETGWTKEQLLDRLCVEKMGLSASAWRDPKARLSIFSTVTLGPEPFMPPGSTNSDP